MTDTAVKLREKAEGARSVVEYVPMDHAAQHAHALNAVLLDLLADYHEAMAHERRGASSAACECPCCLVSRRIGEVAS